MDVFSATLVGCCCDSGYLYMAKEPKYYTPASLFQVRSWLLDNRMLVDFLKVIISLVSGFPM